jgi:hypothetical protein
LRAAAAHLALHLAGELIPAAAGRGRRDDRQHVEWRSCGFLGGK